MIAVQKIKDFQKMFLTFSFSLLFAGVLAIPGHAHDSELGEVMEQMDEVLTEIDALVAKKGSVDLLHEQADTFGFLVDQAKDLVPEIIQNLPQEEKEKAIAQYQALLEELKENAQEIPAHAHHGMWKEAAESLAEVKAIKKKGHDQFKHEHLE